MEQWQASVVVDGKNTLGEGTLWDVEQQRLWWVDIYGKRLFCYDPRSKSHQTHELPDIVGTVVVRDDGSLLIAQGCNVAVFDPASKSVTPFVDVEPQRETHRLNDGKCDPKGRLWVGSMVEEGDGGTASLFCVGADATVSRLLTGATISNGLAWSQDGKSFYYIDTPTQRVEAFDCDLDGPRLTNRRVVFEFTSDMGSPDGMTIDAAGDLWVALFGGRSVVRVDPRRGALTGRVQVAAKNVTSCAFGGPNLDTLFISTGRLATSDEELEGLPSAGALFSVTLPVRGVSSSRFRGAAG